MAKIIGLCPTFQAINLIANNFNSKNRWYHYIYGTSNRIEPATWLFEVVKISNNIKPTTFERYEGIYRNYIKDSSIAALNLSSIKSIQIQRYYNDLYSNEDKKKSSIQIKTLNKLLKQFFNYAVEEGYILKIHVKVSVP